MFRLLFLILFGFLFLEGFSQDRILLLNGRELRGYITDTAFNYVEFREKSDDKKIQRIEAERIFSFTFENSGTEYIVYEPDTTDPDYFTIHEMRMFMYGENEARMHYKTPYTMAGAVLVGFATGFSPFIPLLLTPVVPGIYTFLIGTQFIRINRKAIANKLYLSEETYIYGYEKIGKAKRVQNAIFGSLIGLSGGLAARYIAEELK